MKIGVVIPSHNAGKYLENCLNSINAQTYGKCFTYIVDDASTDNTKEFLEDRPTLYTKFLSSSRRLGWPAALNLAASMAIDDGCEAIFIMNADDFLRLDCIQKAVDAFYDTGDDWQPNDFVVVYAQQVGGENVVQISKERAKLQDFKEYPPLVNYALIPNSLWNSVKGYSTDISLPDSWGYKEDWDFWIKVFKAGHTRYGVVKEPVYYYVMHEGQLHQDGLDRHEEAKKLILEKHGL